MYDRLSPHDGFATFERVMREVTGDDLSAYVEEAETTECPLESYRYFDVECGSGAADDWATSQNAWSTSVELSCGAPETVGPRQGRIWVDRQLTLPSPGAYGLWVKETNVNITVAVRPCGSCYSDDGPGGSTITLQDGQSKVETLEAGTYWVHFEAPESEAPTVELLIWTGF